MLTHVPWSELESTGRASPRLALLPGPRELLYGSPFPALPGPSATGLASPAGRQTFSEKARRLLEFQQTRRLLPADERRRMLTTASNAELRRTGVPEVTSSFSPITSGETLGSMSHESWDLQLNEARIAPPVARRGQPPPPSVSEQMGSIANTIYHESRHAEQHFRVARLMAAGGATAEEIHARTGLPMEVVRAAVASPLEVPETGRTPEMLEAEQWYHSFVGRDAVARAETLRTLHQANLDLAQAHARVLIAGLSGTPEDRVAARRDYELAQSLQEIAHEDYRELPEERDAWEVGDEIERRVRKP